MKDSDRLKCEYCGSTHFEKPIIEMPKRIGFNAKIIPLSLKGERQKNICLDCLKIEVQKRIK